MVSIIHLPQILQTLNQMKPMLFLEAFQGQHTLFISLRLMMQVHPTRTDCPFLLIGIMTEIFLTRANGPNVKRISHSW